MIYYACRSDYAYSYPTHFVMTVKGLWPLLQPTARPVKLESLRNKRLAIDASIWLHQFLRAMRDKEGNALRNAHILGFFRRICKLLFYNIKPVFVFDGGAPTLKRATIVGILPSIFSQHVYRAPYRIWMPKIAILTRIAPIGT